MQGGSHRKIILLLSISLFSIVLVQAFWMRNSYLEKKERFQSNVYGALEQIVDKLHEREQLKIIKERGDSLLSARKKITDALKKKKSTHKVTRTYSEGSGATAFVFSDNTMILSDSPADLAFATMNSTWPADSNLLLTSKEVRTTRQVQVVNDKVKHLSVSVQRFEKDPDPLNKAMAMAKQLARDEKEDSLWESEMETLMGRLFTEINIEGIDEANPERLRHVISAVLESKGISTRFEFSRKMMLHNKYERVVQSPGFDSTRYSYKADISSKRILTTNDRLLLQFPEQDTLVFASMKGSLLLSFLFLGIILSVFYYTLRLILQQKKISEIKNDFVNNMTHELKTPIATISLAVDAMQHPQVRTSEQRYNEYTRILREENRKLNIHVERVLQLALFDKGQMEMNFKVTDAAAIAESQVKAYGLRAESNGMQLYFSKTGGSFEILGDEEHLGSAISNLIDNAIKYSNKNSVVNVNVVSNETQVCISVRDTGRGMAKGDLEKVFDKFYRVSNKDLHDVKGFGIGLSYVKSIVEAHEGRISVESEPGKGSTFKITLKRHE